MISRKCHVIPEKSREYGEWYGWSKERAVHAAEYEDCRVRHKEFIDTGGSMRTFWIREHQSHSCSSASGRMCVTSVSSQTSLSMFQHNCITNSIFYSMGNMEISFTFTASYRVLMLFPTFSAHVNCKQISICDSNARDLTGQKIIRYTIIL